MVNSRYFLAAGFLMISSPAFASDFNAACVDGAPDGTPAEGAEAFCSCLDEATDGDSALRSELIDSWPVSGTIEEWSETLSEDAQQAAASCAP